MPTTKVQIANMALGHCGVLGGIESLEEASDEARACKLYFDAAVEQVLASAHWPFAQRRKALARDATPPPPEWLYRYVIPSDCVTAIELEDGKKRARVEERVPFAIEAHEDGSRTVLLTDNDSAILIYTARVTNAGAFPPTFVGALAWLLASYIAMPLGKSQKLADTALEKYEYLRVRAMTHAANQGEPGPDSDGEFVEARR